MEFQHNDVNYRSSKLNAMTQFHVGRRLAPLLKALAGLEKSKLDETVILTSLLDAIGQMSDEDTEYVIFKCLDVVRREEPGGKGWAKVLAAGGKTLMYPDIDDLVSMLTIVSHVLRDNLTAFFPTGGLNLEEFKTGRP